MVEHYADTVKVKGSNPLIITNWFVAQWQMHRAFNPGVVSSSLTGPTNKRTNSSMAERWFVRPMVESSNLSSSSELGELTER
jgi:hypothetical protein